MREGFLDDVRQWGEKDARIDGIFLVGSYARGTATEESDVDLVILTPRKTELVSDPGFYTPVWQSKEILCGNLGRLHVSPGIL